MVESAAANPVGEWVSLGYACRQLGVNESTLRRWADGGRVRSFRTPGGHRRFATGDLLRLQQTSPEVSHAAADYQALGNLALARIRRRLQQGKPQRSTWYSTVDEASRMRFRPLGRRLVALAADCLGKRMRGGRLLDEARAIGREYGAELVRDGVAPRDAVEAFTFFRQSLDETTRQLAHRASMSAEAAAEAWEQVSGLADLVLVAMMEAFDSGRNAREELSE